MNKKPSKLLDATTAVSSYLDNLLQEATEPVEAASPHIELEHHNIHVLETPLTTAKQITKNDVAQVPIEKVELEHDLGKAVEEQEVTLSLKEQFVYPIQCLMFKVKGHLLATPLIKMGSVVPFGGHLTQLPYSPGYFKGLLKHRDKTVRVADTASLLLNEKQSSGDTEEFSPSHLLVFENDDWAISCDELLDVVTLSEDDIKWHSDEKRLSLGTIKTTLALILNPEAISKRLTNTSV